MADQMDYPIDYPVELIDELRGDRARCLEIITELNLILNRTICKAYTEYGIMTRNCAIGRALGMYAGRVNPANGKEEHKGWISDGLIGVQVSEGLLVQAWKKGPYLPNVGDDADADEVVANVVADVVANGGVDVVANGGDVKDAADV